MFLFLGVPFRRKIDQKIPLGAGYLDSNQHWITDLDPASGQAALFVVAFKMPTTKNKALLAYLLRSGSWRPKILRIRTWFFEAVFLDFVRYGNLLLTAITSLVGVFREHVTWNEKIPAVIWALLLYSGSYSLWYLHSSLHSRIQVKWMPTDYDRYDLWYPTHSAACVPWHDKEYIWKICWSRALFKTRHKVEDPHSWYPDPEFLKSLELGTRNVSLNKGKKKHLLLVKFLTVPKLLKG